jgi:4-hydroxybenzoyl-CoA thioesterase
MNTNTETKLGEPAPRWVFERRERVRFGHCDPAGIVFYPRYFEMLNALIEDWVSEGLGVDFSQLLGPRRVGLPTVHLETDFRRISRMGDTLIQRIAITRLGRSSLGLTVHFEGEGDDEGRAPESSEPHPGPRVVFQQVLVCTSLDTHRPQAFPDDLRAALQAALDRPASQARGVSSP